jgi:hypothetical protein
VTTPPALPSTSAVVVATDRQVACEVGGEAVVLQMDQGVYYGLNSVAARVWQLLQSPHSVDSLIEQVLQEFDVERERCALDVRELIADLARKQLVRVIDTSPP